jgi:DNA invertase Pin-like site-specific DNA recombinase
MNVKESATGQIVGYARVSSVDQDTARQLEALKALGVHRLFEDRASGKDMNRPNLEEAMKYVRAGDTLAVHSLDRLARNLVDLLRVVDELTGKGVTIMFLKENLTFSNSDNNHTSKLMLQMLGAFAQFERSLIRERQREGIAIAKKLGAFKGRKHALNEEQVKELVALDTKNHGKNRTALAKQFGISRNSLYRYLEKA